MTRMPSTVERKSHATLRPEFTILSCPLLHCANAPYPVRPFITGSLRCLPLLPQTRTLCRSSTIRTRASGSPSKRWGTCETADHSPQAQLPLVCTIFPTTILPQPRLHNRLPRFQESRSSPPNFEASTSTLPTDSADDANSVDFVARVSTIPLVNTALRAYEHTKASSKVVKVRFYPSPLSTTSILTQLDLDTR